MVKVLMKAPEGMSALSIAGMEVKPTDGMVEVEDHIARELTAHGFQYDSPPPMEIGRAAHITRLMQDSRKAYESLTDGNLIDFAGLLDIDREAFFTDLTKLVVRWPSIIANRKTELARRTPEEERTGDTGLNLYKDNPDPFKGDNVVEHHKDSRKLPPDDPKVKPTEDLKAPAKPADDSKAHKADDHKK